MDRIGIETSKNQGQACGHTIGIGHRWCSAILVIALVLGVTALNCETRSEVSDADIAQIPDDVDITSMPDQADTKAHDEVNVEPLKRFDPVAHFDEAFAAIPDCDTPRLVSVSVEVEPVGVSLADKIFQPWRYHFTCQAGIGTTDMVTVTLEPEPEAVVDCHGQLCPPDGFWFLSQEDCTAITIGIDAMVERASASLDFDVISISLHKPMVPPMDPASGIYYYLFSASGIEATVNAETGELVLDE